MYIIDSLRTFIDDLGEKDFYKYFSAFIGLFTLLVLFIFFQYYSAVTELSDRIDEINNQREEVQHILTTLKKVTKQREEIDAILAQDEDFKLGNYFSKLLDKFRLSEKKRAVDYSDIDHGALYKESILKARLSDLNMKELSELLYEIEQNQRVYSKELEIIKSRKGMLDINLTIATLEPKALTMG